MLVITDVESQSRARIVRVTTRRWLETPSPLDVPVGMAPLVIDRASGEVHVYGSGPDGHAAFATWLD